MNKWRWELTVLLYLQSYTAVSTSSARCAQVTIWPTGCYSFSSPSKNRWKAFLHELFSKTTHRQPQDCRLFRFLMCIQCTWLNNTFCRVWLLKLKWRNCFSFYWNSRHYTVGVNGENFFLLSRNGKSTFVFILLHIIYDIFVLLPTY